MGQIFLKAEKYLYKLDAKNIEWFVEIGTSRAGDDGSTPIIASWAERFGRKLYTVDIDPDNITFAINMEILNLRTWLGSGENFFYNFPEHLGRISVLYLDNFDWDWHPDNSEDFVLEQKQRYQELGLEMNNVNCQAAHIHQAVLASKFMAEKSIIILDDTFYDPKWATYTGKGGAVVPYLISQGYQILETEEYPVYGTIMGRF